MNSYTDSKWVKEIAALQKDDGSWGYFHTLSNPSKSNSMTTEQSIRRLKILGLTEDDIIIKRSIDYLERCIRREIEIPDRKEKFRDWYIFTDLMFAVWIKIFSSHSEISMGIAEKWAYIIENAFAGDDYDHNKYIDSFTEIFNIKPHNGRTKDFITFYQISILQGMLKQKTEEKFIDYIINRDSGIYYVYNNRIKDLPISFDSKVTCRYLSAIELLAEYDCCKEKLHFVADWIRENKGEDGYWDLGPAARDGINFPLSDSWRRADDRKKDCTYRIKNLLLKIG